MALKSIQDFINDSNSTNSNSDKLEVIKKYSNNPDVLKGLQYTYDTFKQYYVTSKNCKKRSDLCIPFTPYSTIFELLDALSSREITGHDAIESVNGFVEENKIYEDVIWRIIDRNLKTRSTVSMINKVIPGLVPTFDVALAQAYDEKTKKKVDWKDGWFVSRKLDGVRCLTVVDEEGNISFYSRAGNEFTTLDSLKPTIAAMGVKDCVLDGEVCLVDEDGNEDFQGIIKQIKRKNHTIAKPHYYIFDYLTSEEFSSKTSERILEERLSEIQEVLRIWVATYAKINVEVLTQVPASDKILENMMALSKEEGWEGLMLRKNTTYQGKRSADILKVKKFYDAEYIVVDVENALNRVIVNGKEVEEMMLKNVVIEHKGSRVQVGSGFSHEQKRFYYENPNEILGKQITVQYFEETQNQHGEHSLRFPVVKAIYETKRNF